MRISASVFALSIGLGLGLAPVLLFAQSITPKPTPLAYRPHWRHMTIEAFSKDGFLSALPGGEKFEALRAARAKLNWSGLGIEQLSSWDTRFSMEINPVEIYPDRRRTIQNDPHQRRAALEYYRRLTQLLKDKALAESDPKTYFALTQESVRAASAHLEHHQVSHTVHRHKDGRIFIKILGEADKSAPVLNRGAGGVLKKFRTQIIFDPVRNFSDGFLGMVDTDFRGNRTLYSSVEGIANRSFSESTMMHEMGHVVRSEKAGVKISSSTQTAIPGSSSRHYDTYLSFDELRAFHQNALQNARELKHAALDLDPRAPNWTRSQSLLEAHSRQLKTVSARTVSMLTQALEVGRISALGEGEAMIRVPGPGQTTYTITIDDPAFTGPQRIQDLDRFEPIVAERVEKYRRQASARLALADRIIRSLEETTIESNRITRTGSPEALKQKRILWAQALEEGIRAESRLPGESGYRPPKPWTAFGSRVSGETLWDRFARGEEAPRFRSATVEAELIQIREIDPSQKPTPSNRVVQSTQALALDDAPERSPTREFLKPRMQFRDFALAAGAGAAIDNTARRLVRGELKDASAGEVATLVAVDGASGVATGGIMQGLHTQATRALTRAPAVIKNVATGAAVGAGVFANIALDVTRLGTGSDRAFHAERLSDQRRAHARLGAILRSFSKRDDYQAELEKLLVTYGMEADSALIRAYGEALTEATTHLTADQLFEFLTSTTFESLMERDRRRIRNGRMGVNQAGKLIVKSGFLDFGRAAEIRVSCDPMPNRGPGSLPVFEEIQKLLKAMPKDHE